MDRVRVLLTAVYLSVAICQGNAVSANDFTDTRARAERGDAAAQVKLGFFYDSGKEVPKDDKEAARWYRAAAQQGNASGQFNLGVLYNTGQGVSLDYQEALRWYKAAAAQGHAKAQYNLGLLYEQGVGVARDYKEAANWYKSSAANGFPYAYNNLGSLYTDGHGVPQNYIMAYMWYHISTLLNTDKLGTDTSSSNKAIISEVLSQSQIALAVDLASRCQKALYQNCDQLYANVAGNSEQGVIAPGAKVGKYGAGIPLEAQGGTFVVPVSINNAITLDFVIDSGASDVSIPVDVVRTLVRTGTLRPTDFLGKRTYQLADGSSVPSQTFRIRVLKVGDREIENVTGSIGNVDSPLLLGQSFLNCFRSWSIDNRRQLLLLD